MDESTDRRLLTLKKKMSRKVEQKKIICDKLEKQIHPDDKTENLPEMPYADYDTVRKEKELNYRFVLADDHVPSATENGFVVPEGHIAPLVFATWAAAQYVTIQMKRKGITRKYASEMSGIDYTLFSRYQSYNRPFTPMPENLSCLCQNVLHESAHKVMFGEEGKIILPRIYSVIFSGLENASGRTMNKLLAKARQTKQQYEDEYPSDLPNGPHRDQVDMVRERMADLATDVGRPCRYLLRNEESVLPMNKRLYCTMFSLFPDVDKPKEKFNLSTLMYFAFETRYALDYFVSEDFTKYCPVYLLKNKDEVQVTDPKILEIIGICYEVDKERKIDLLADIFGATI